MKEDLFIQEGIVIPGHELDITASRAGGPGGQHVNKASTRITLRWNVQDTEAFSDAQKTRVLRKLKSEVTAVGDLIIHQSASRSQHRNKQEALKLLAQKIRKALIVPKKRKKTKVPKAVKESRLKEKKGRGALKKIRGEKFDS